MDGNLAIFGCFPRCTSRQQDQKWSTVNSNWHSHDASAVVLPAVHGTVSLSSVLDCLPIPLQHFTCLKYLGSSLKFPVMKCPSKYIGVRVCSLHPFQAVTGDRMVVGVQSHITRSVHADIGYQCPELSMVQADIGDLQVKVTSLILKEELNSLFIPASPSTNRERKVETQLDCCGC